MRNQPNCGGMKADRQSRLKSIAFSSMTFVGITMVSIPQLADAAWVCNPFGNVPAQTYPVGHQNHPLSIPPVSAVPSCTNGALLGPWNDSDGTPRYACLWKPTTVSGPLPLVVYLHPSMSSADNVQSDIMNNINTADLSGLANETGYILLAPQGRFTQHFYGDVYPNLPPSIPDNGSNPTISEQNSDLVNTGWDNWYRQLSPNGDVAVNGVTYKENVDAATVDHFIQNAKSAAQIDTKRIFMIGWSNGGAMAYLYGLNRPSGSAALGGDGVAAVAVYSAPDPFAALDDPCMQTPVGGTATNGQIHLYSISMPSYHVHNYCDVGGQCPNVKNLLTPSLVSQGSPVTEIIIKHDSNQTQVTPPACDQSCGVDTAIYGTSPGSLLGALNHASWPTAWTSSMFSFLKNHPLP
jgi:dienelactone hydrolase